MSKDEMQKRNDALCADYKAGKTVSDLAVAYDISNQRVRQILAKANIDLRDDRKPSEGLDEFLAINVTDDEKEELRRLAEDNSTSMAALSREWIRERLAEIRARKQECSST